jgi:phosphatidate cytidylyltransferase
MNDRNRNLAARVVSALVLFPLLVWATWTGGLPFSLLLAAAAAISAVELVGMFTPLAAPEWFGVAVTALLPLAPWWAARTEAHTYPPEVPISFAVAGMVLLALHLFRRGGFEGAPQRAAAVALAWVYCGVLIASVGGLRLRFGFAWVILAFVATWANDTAAYFAGRFLGRHAMCPSISPKKTWEGFAGGAAGSVAGALATKAVFLALPTPAGETLWLSWGGAVAVGLGASLLGPLGDLVESMLKRAAGVKDSGHLIPGHGGLLDRIDALLFVAPWIYFWAALTS